LDLKKSRPKAAVLSSSRRRRTFDKPTFGRWMCAVALFVDPIIAMAILYWLFHHCVVINIKGA
jgi:hypothetical protein